MLLYVPNAVKLSCELPIFLWFVFSISTSQLSNRPKDPWGFLHFWFGNWAWVGWH